MRRHASGKGKHAAALEFREEEEDIKSAKLQIKAGRFAHLPDFYVSSFLKLGGASTLKKNTIAIKPPPRTLIHTFTKDIIISNLCTIVFEVLFEGFQLLFTSRTSLIKVKQSHGMHPTQNQSLRFLIRKAVHCEKKHTA